MLTSGSVLLGTELCLAGARGDRAMARALREELDAERARRPEVA
jgi:hypothetical protein